MKNTCKFCGRKDTLKILNKYCTTNCAWLKMKECWEEFWELRKELNGK